MSWPDDKLLEDVMALAVKAGHEILRIYETDYAIEHKDDMPPLTEADMAAHHLISSGPTHLQPTFAIFSAACR